jgi:hypothetical protein
MVGMHHICLTSSLGLCLGLLALVHRHSLFLSLAMVPLMCLQDVIYGADMERDVDRQLSGASAA